MPGERLRTVTIRIGDPFISRIHAGLRGLLAVVVLLVSQSFGLADEADRGGAKYAKAIETQARLAAEIEVLKAENSVLTAEERSASSVLLQDITRVENTQLRDRLISVLDTNFNGVASAMGATADSAPSVVEELQRNLAHVRDRLIADRELLLEVRAQGHFSGQLASLLNVSNKWLWLGGLVAFGTLIGAVALDRRHGLRRLLWVRRTRAAAFIGLGLLFLSIPLLPTILTFALGDQTYDALLAYTSRQSAAELGEDPAEQLKAVEAQISKLDEERQSLTIAKQKLVTKLQKRLTDLLGNRMSLANDWESLRDGIAKTCVALLIPQAISKEILIDNQRVADLESKLDNEKRGIESSGRMKRLAGAAVGLGLLGMVMCCGLVFQRSINFRQKQIAATCPRCLTAGKLKAEPPPLGAPANLRADLREVRCANVISEEPYEECGFMFRAQYRNRVKISFPTLGVSQSGKTHWLAMIYQQLNRGKAPDGVHFEKIQSSGSARFDLMVNDILQARVGMSATRQGLPEPLIFGFRDRDKLSMGGADVIVNIFDFAGTVSMTVGLHDSIRVRQLNSEGFLFFLDPTKPSDAQVDALLKFREEVKLVKRLGAGRQLHTPVALCVSKIDMTVYQDYAMGGDVMNSFFEGLNRVDSRTAPMSLARMQQRSDLVADLRDTIWPSWEIENQVRALFGDRFLFFPMTPVGLPPQGVTDSRIIDDLGQRTIAPYGIVEPLIWLLHMNGYPVLQS